MFFTTLLPSANATTITCAGLTWTKIDTGANVACSSNSALSITGNGAWANGVISINNYTPPYIVNFTYNLSVNSGYAYGGLNLYPATLYTPGSVTGGLVAYLTTPAGTQYIYDNSSNLFTSTYLAKSDMNVSIVVNATGYQYYLNNTLLLNNGTKVIPYNDLVFSEFQAGVTLYVKNVVVTNVTIPNINITSWGNNYTNNQTLNFSAPYNTATNFNITTNIASDLITWIVNNQTTKLAPYNATSTLYIDNETFFGYYTATAAAPAYVDFNSNGSSGYLQVKVGNGLANIEAYNFSSNSYEILGIFNTAPQWDNFSISKPYFNNTGTVKIRVRPSTNTRVYEIWVFGTTNPSATNFSNQFQAIGINTVNATVFNSTSNSYDYRNWTVNVTNIPFALTSPSNGSTVSTPVTLTSQEWPQNAPYTYFVCLDAICNSVVSTGTMTNTNTINETVSVNLNLGVKYYWYVKNSLGVSTSTQNFTISLPSPDGQTGIQGQVYYYLNNQFTPIPGATVFIYNGTWSSTITTSADGYFLIEPLANNSLYYLQAKAPNFADGSIEPVTTTNGAWTLHNLQLQPCTGSFTCNFNTIFVTFAVQNIIFQRFPNVDAKVYTVGTQILLQEKTTNTAGEVNFYLIKDTQYTIVFTDSSQGVSVTWSGTPPLSGYQYIIVPLTPQGQFTGNTDVLATIYTNVSTSNNGTSGFINMSYFDTLGQTSGLTFYLNQSIASDPNNQTNLQILTPGSSSNYNASFVVTPYAGTNYIITVTAQHSTLGTIIRSYGISFPANSPLANFNPISVLMLIVGLILFIAGFWGQTSTEQGAGIIVGFTWLLSGMSLFVNLNLGLNFYLGLTLATLITILMNVNARARREGIA